MPDHGHYRQTRLEPPGQRLKRFWERWTGASSGKLQRVYRVDIGDQSLKRIVFPDAELPVHDVFVLVGTRDERNFHLKALSAIAQIVQDPAFHGKWMAAKGPEALRDIFLLGDRMRGWPTT